MKAFFKEHNYNVTNWLGDADTNFVARFTTEGKVFDIINCTLILRIWDWNWSIKFKK